ncbi:MULTISPECIES: hypothetical protein [unclassified Arcicella]|uniref:hypothetical protein n=1 Tax=unclassified Arcicella TaxID=2644986 RepID=UPI0028631098|nr:MULTISPECIES: hypothetical protein [unclassified Arcicella]MDR6563274.1 hypothetical protein [Arcicella sp. BE51]MDR6813305.1 hypothetical protein [Arcicella sp. BE140]MDR6824619.1 hypothetical protein [Arcicella sp. BE139]
MRTKELLSIIKNSDLPFEVINQISQVEILAKFVQTRAILLDIYGVRNKMFADATYRNNSGDTRFYEGLNEVVSKLEKSKSENILFLEVNTEEGDEISLFFQEDDNLFLGYIYIY